jgi:putative membrane protein
MSSILALVLAIALTWAAAAIILMIVSRLGMGLTVSGFGAAFIAAAVISIVGGVVTWLLGLLGITLGGTGLLAAIFGVIVAAVVLLISDRFVSGLKVNGFTGAIVAAIAYGAVVWLITWVLGLFF